MTQSLGLGLILLNKVAGLLRRHSFFDPRPFLWNLAMLGYFVVSIVFLLPLSLPYSPPVDLLLGLIGFPGLIYSFFELAKIGDEASRTLVWTRNVMGICWVMFVFFGLVLRSVNNRAVSVGGQFPFYSTLRSVGRIAGPILNIVFGGGAVLIRRKLPYSLFRVQEEEPVRAPSRRRSPLRFIAVAGVLLIFVGIYMGLFDVVALEALVLLVTGLILLPTAFLIRRFSKAKSPASVVP